MSSQKQADPVKVLALLEAYSTKHEAASLSLREALWELTKARRAEARGAVLAETRFSAVQVRDDLVARAVLRVEEAEPELLEEEKIDKQSAKQQQLDTFVLVDAVEERRAGKENHVVRPVEEKSTGLRQRKGQNQKVMEEATVSSWTEEVHEDRLRTADPLELFGAITPRELKQSQARAKKALQAYVEAASLLAVLQQELTEK